MKWLDKIADRLGYYPKRLVPAIDYDFATGEIHVDLKMGFPPARRHRIHGFVCPTPDGPLKKIINDPNPLFVNTR